MGCHHLWIVFSSLHFAITSSITMLHKLLPHDSSPPSILQFSQSTFLQLKSPMNVMLSLTITLSTVKCHPPSYCNPFHSMLSSYGGMKATGMSLFLLSFTQFYFFHHHFPFYHYYHSTSKLPISALFQTLNFPFPISKSLISLFNFVVVKVGIFVCFCKSILW